MVMEVGVLRVFGEDKTVEMSKLMQTFHKELGEVGVHP